MCHVFPVPLHNPFLWRLDSHCDWIKSWIDCALGSATGVYHVSKFNSSVRTISSPDITRFSSSSISCTSENDFSGFGTCAQHGNIGSQAVRAEPALLEKRIFRPGPSELYPPLVFARAVPTVITYIICASIVFDHE